MKNLNPKTKLGQMRLKKGMSQQELAWETGLNVRLIQKLESKKGMLRRACWDSVQLIAQALNCKAEDLQD